jgi:hypothetical protein
MVILVSGLCRDNLKRKHISSYNIWLQMVEFPPKGRTELRLIYFSLFLVGLSN